MQALTLAPQTQTHHGLPSPESARAGTSEAVKAAETARPATAPAEVGASAPQTRETRLAEPVRAEPRSVVTAKDEVAGGETGAPHEAKAPDPMVPPVPMRYLSELIKPQEQTPPVSEDAGADEAAGVARTRAAEAAAGTDSGLDILR